MPCLRAGIVVFKRGKRCAMYARRRHHPETNANCIIVRVIGLGNALSIDFEEVLVKAEVRYQIRQRTCSKYQSGERNTLEDTHTIVLTDIGAFNASASSCAFSLTLAFLLRMVLNASLRLFCREWPCSLAPKTFKCPFPQDR